ncbi:hypothetical protein N7917_06805 [Bacillus sp. OR9]|nr:hypothetical protein [Bacillus sp. OR9]
MEILCGFHCFKGKDFSNEKLLEVIQLGNKFLSSLISFKHVEDCNVRDQLITEMIKENDYIGLEKLLNIFQDELITKEHVYDNEKYYYFYYRFFLDIKNYYKLII